LPQGISAIPSYDVWGSSSSAAASVQGPLINPCTSFLAVIISMCWVAGTIVGFLPLFGWYNTEFKYDEECLFVEVMDYNYLVFLYFATIITPALLMLGFYTHIYRVIIKQVSGLNLLKN